jgi:hypothetical protein
MVRKSCRPDPQGRRVNGSLRPVPLASEFALKIIKAGEWMKMFMSRFTYYGHDVLHTSDDRIKI